MRHVMELSIGIGIAKLLEEYEVSKVYVINPGRYISIISVLMWSLMSEDLKSKIVFCGGKV